MNDIKKYTVFTLMLITATSEPILIESRPSESHCSNKMRDFKTSGTFSVWKCRN